MEIMERVFFQQFSGFIKLALGFSWKSHHHIGTDADALNLIHCLLYFLNKLARLITAFHVLEDLIRSGLKWKMEKGNQFMLGIIHSFQNSLRHRCGFDGTDSDSFRTFQTMKGIDDIQQVFSLIKISSDIDSSQDDFFNSFFIQ